MNPPELEKPRVTEILVRMDCNGCVQKIKKTLHGINDPEKIVRAVRKSRKTATICSHSEPTKQQAQPTEAAPEGVQPPTESANPPPPEAPPAETSPPAETPKDPPPPENPPLEVVPPPPATEAAPPASQPGQSGEPKDVEEVYVIYHHSPDYGYIYRYGPSNHSGGQGSSVINAPGVEMGNYPAGPGTRPHKPPIYVAHNYNTYKPSPYVTEYVSPLQQYSQPNRPETPNSPQHVHYNRTEPAQSYSSTEPPQHMNYSRPVLPPPPQVNYSRHEPPKYMHYSRQEPPQYSHYSTPEPQKHTYYSRPEQYSEDYRNDNGNITSVFSDENPNACTIV